MKSRFDFLWRGLRATLTGINLFLAMGMLAVYAIPWLDPRWLAPLALVGFLYYPLLAGLIICSVLWIIRRNARFWISVVIIALGWKVHSVWWQLPWPSNAEPFTHALVQGDFQKAPYDSKRNWKVISYNVGTFKLQDPSSVTPISSSRDFLLNLLDAVQPDLVGLQDFVSWEPSKSDVLKSLRLHPGLQRYTLRGQDAKRRSFRILLDASKPFHSQLYRHQGKGSDDGASIERLRWVSGMVMLTRWPVLDHGYQNLGEPSHNGGMMWADMLMAKDTLRWVNLHLASNQISPPELSPVQALELKSDSSQRTIKGILRKIAYSARLRAEQSDQIRAFMDESPYPLLVTGDFNDLPFSFAVNRIQHKLKDTFEGKGQGMGNTYARGFLSFRIDHVMVDPRFPVLSHELVRLRYSDHYPIVAVLGR
ncbi:MAG: endonuclease/exonuclease/phosphatase family protein [Bacteroidota bacterium]